MHKSVTTLPLLIAFLFFLITPRPSSAQVLRSSEVTIRNFPETQHVKGDVRINNFPEMQQIKGSVSIEGTTKSLKREHVVVPTSRRAELSEMVFAGIVETEGFTSMVISLQGEVTNDVFSSGTIGVLLIPDEKPILHTFRIAKRLQFPIECVVQTKSGDAIYFESREVQQRIAFPRYKMFLYNTVNNAVDANVYLYLSNSPAIIVPGSSVK